MLLTVEDKLKAAKGDLKKVRELFDASVNLPTRIIPPYPLSAVW